MAELNEDERKLLVGCLHNAIWLGSHADDCRRIDGHLHVVAEGRLVEVQALVERFWQGQDG